MADENTQGAPPAQPPATPADAGGGNKPEPLLNYKEVVELRKETRELGNLVKQFLERESGRSNPTPAPTPPKAEPKTESAAPAVNADIAALTARLDASERNNALKDAFLEHGITDPDLRDLIRGVASSASPTDVGAIVAKYAKFKPAAAAPTSEPVKPAAPNASDTGPAGGASRTQIPNDILAVSPEAWKQLSPEEKRARYEAEKRAKGGDYNPFAEAKRASQKK